jgi:hypothetical protein
MVASYSHFIGKGSNAISGDVSQLKSGRIYYGQTLELDERVLQLVKTVCRAARGAVVFTCNLDRCRYSFGAVCRS